jgi:hypothetical protein
VCCFGKETNIQNRTNYKGVIRDYKDPQRLYNYMRSTTAETVALAPRVPWLVTSKMIAPFKGIWDAIHRKNFNYLPYDPDPQVPQGRPVREQSAMPNMGAQQEASVADQEMHDTTGLSEASLGEKSNERSGLAVEKRAALSGLSQYAYLDNRARAIMYTGKVLLDLIPRIYDTERVVRIIGEDGSSKKITVNGEGKDGEAFNLMVGRYDCVVSTGPAYQTQRQEVRDNIMEFVKYVQPAGPLLADIFVAHSDWPGADVAAKRLRKVLVPANAIEPEEGEQPPPPDPAQEMEAKKAEFELQALAAKAAAEKAKAEQEALTVQLKQKEIEKVTAEIVKANVEIERLHRAPVTASKESKTS